MRLVRFRSNCRRSFCRCKYACGSCARPRSRLSSPFPLIAFSKKAPLIWASIALRAHDASIGGQTMVQVTRLVGGARTETAPLARSRNFEDRRARELARSCAQDKRGEQVN